MWNMENLRKNMKTNRIIALLAAAALTLSVSAQQAAHDNYVGVSFGGGLNTMLYKTANGQQNIGGGIDAGLFYGHFFNQTVGLGVGLQYTWANARATYNYSEVSTGLTHPNNPNTLYNLSTTYTDWRERQTVGVLSIPVEVLFRKALSERWAFIGGVGFSLDFPVHGSYAPLGGTYATTGIFPKLGNYTVSNLPEHGFDTYTTTQGGKMDNLAKVGASAIADLGFRVAFNDNWGMYIGAYFGYGFTNLLAQAKSDPLVIINDQQKIDYSGTFASDETAKANLLRCGLKIAFDFGWPADNKKQLEAERLAREAFVADSITNAERMAKERAERHERFEQYKREQQAVCGNMAEPDDSDEAKALIAKAQSDIAALQYDDNLSEEQNRARVDAIVEQLRRDLAAQRERDKQKAAEQEAKAEQEHVEELKHEVSEINFYYETEKTDVNISESEQKAFDELCERMKNDSSLKIVITGHTDNYGDPEQNLRFYGMKRAESLKALMVSKGVPAEQIRCESKGQTEPIAPNDTRANRAKNRRANIRFE
jgi:outer membrane protein OmpA-like peptidoglycan-associated protein